MSSDQAAAPARFPVGAVRVLAVAAFFYAGMMANLGEIQNANTDAMGRGMAAGFGLVFLIAEWFFLGVLLLIGGVKGEMPVSTAIAAALLLPLSGLSAGNALFRLEDGGSPLYQLVPGLIAPTIAAYALWARLPALHQLMPPVPASLIAWGAVALLSATPVLHPF